MDSSIAQFVSYEAITRIIAQSIGLLAVLYILVFRPLRFNKHNTFWIAFAIGFLIICRFAMQPVGWGTGGDREHYAFKLWFAPESLWQSILEQSDPLFTLLSEVIYRTTDLNCFYWTIAFLYVGFYFYSAKRLAGKRIVWMLIAILLSMGFISYGIITLRAGLAIALLLLGITYSYKKLPIAIIFMVLALLTHISVIIPITMFLISKFLPKPRIFFILWIISIPLSFVAGNLFNSLVASFAQESRTQYLVGESETYNIGFRIDFILYSLLPIAIGYYYIFRRKFNSVLYKNIYNTYVLTNTFWILVIRANFSDRFAYLSWFLIPVIMVYPLLRNPKIVRNPNAWLASIIAGETLFSLLF